MNTLLAKAAVLPGAFLVQTATAFAQSSSTRAEAYDWGPGMMWGGGQWGGFGFVLGPVFMILILIAIIAGVLYLVRAFGAPTRAAPRDHVGDALAILNERFARGEIDEKEYQDRKRILQDR